jgi:hypothetical protein
MNFVNFFFKMRPRKQRLVPQLSERKALSLVSGVSGTAHACAKVIRGSKITLHPVFGPPFTPYPLSFSGIRAQEKKERQDETQFTTKIDGFVTPPPPPNFIITLHAAK